MKDGQLLKTLQNPFCISLYCTSTMVAGGVGWGNVCPGAPKLVFWELKLSLWTTALIFKLWSQPKVWAPTSAVNCDRLKSLRPWVSSAPTVNPFFLTFSREAQTSYSTREHQHNGEKDSAMGKKGTREVAGESGWSAYEEMSDLT